MKFFRIVRDFDRSPRTSTSVMLEERYSDATEARNIADAKQRTEKDKRITYRSVPEK